MEEIKVSVVCITYNHEKYIRKALEGFVSQKTNFKYEVIVHDDCSTDNTANIIKEYENKYPDIIKPIYQKENQYSKGVKLWKTYILPIIKGEYIAICEGDDYWCDENKLQTQYDYMLVNPDCYCCTHSFVIHDCNSGEDTTVIRSERDRDFSTDEIIDGRGGLFATNSLFMKREIKENMPSCFNSKYFGDYQMPIYSSILGKVHYINKVMSVYNSMTTGSWTSNSEASAKRQLNIINDEIRMLMSVNEHYGLKYNDAITNAINRLKVFVFILNDEYDKLIDNSYYNNHKEEFPLGTDKKVKIARISMPLLRFMLKVIRKLRK